MHRTLRVMMTLAATLVLAHRGRAELTAYRFSGFNTGNQKTSSGFIVVDLDAKPSGYGLSGSSWTTTYSGSNFLGGQLTYDSADPKTTVTIPNATVTTYQNWPVFDPNGENTDVIAQATSGVNAFFNFYARRANHPSATNQTPLSTYNLASAHQILGSRGPNASSGLNIQNPTVQQLTYDGIGPPGLQLPHVPAQSFDVAKLAGVMQPRYLAFQQALQLQTGRTFTPSSGFRSVELQNHFIDIKNAFDRLSAHMSVTRTLNGKKPQLSNALLLPEGMQKIAAINTEILTQHGLVADKTGSPNVAKLNPAHPQGLAFDLSQDDIDFLVTSVGETTVREMAVSNGLKWLYPGDEVHFEYDGLINNPGFDIGTLDGWDIRGEGLATPVPHPLDPFDRVCRLTAGSPVELAEVFDVPAEPSRIVFQSAFESGAGALDVYLDALLIGHLDTTEPPASLVNVAFDIPQSKSGTRAELRFVFDGPHGATFLLDSIEVVETARSADFNNDGEVDVDDLTIWADHFGATENTLRAHGNADSDQQIDGNDFLMWQRQVGSQVSPTTTQTPEPASAALVVTALVSCASRRLRSPGERF